MCFKKYKYCIHFVLFLLFVQIAIGQENQNTDSTSSKGFFGNLGFDINASSYFNLWFNSDDRDDDEYSGAAIDYETEGLQTWTMEASLKWKGKYVIGGSIERPFKDTPEQREIIKKTTNSQTSLESYLFYLQLPFLRDFTDNDFVEFLSKWRLDYRRYIFFGKGISVEPAIFFSKSGKQLFLDVDDSFRFKSNFQDWDLTYLFATNRRGGKFRLGLYKSEINKPYETRYDYYVNNVDATQVIETRLSGWGGVLDIEAPFLKMILKIGKVKFESLGKLEGYDPFANEGSLDFLLYLKFWTTYHLAGNTGSQFNIKPAIGMQFRADYLETSGLDESIDSDELSMDIILDFGIAINWLYL